MTEDFSGKSIPANNMARYLPTESFQAASGPSPGHRTSPPKAHQALQPSHGNPAISSQVWLALIHWARGSQFDWIQALEPNRHHLP